MAIGSYSALDFQCLHHSCCEVALWCESCSQLICTRCISQAPNSTALHRDHVYLDLQEAYDIQRETFEKEIASFRAELQNKTCEKRELESVVQKLQFELLRKNTETEKRTRALQDALRHSQNNYHRTLEGLVSPALHRSQSAYQEVEYDVVSREGILGAAEAILTTPPEKAVHFLKGLADVRKNMVPMSQNSTVPISDTLPELTQLQRLHLSLNRGQRCVTQAFTFPTAAPSPPKLLPEWTTVGHNSATIAWKCRKSEPIDRIVLRYKPVSVWNRFCFGRNGKPAEMEPRLSVEESHSEGKHSLNAHNPRVLSTAERRDRKERWTEVVISKFTSGRSLAVLRHLVPNTTYHLQISAVNACGSSPFTHAYIATATGGKTNIYRCGRLLFEPPTCELTCKRVCRYAAALMMKSLLLVGMITLLSYLIFSVYVIYSHTDQVAHLACQAVESYSDWLPSAVISVCSDLVASQQGNGYWCAQRATMDTGSMGLWPVEWLQDLLLTWWR